MRLPVKLLFKTAILIFVWTFLLLIFKMMQSAPPSSDDYQTRKKLLKSMTLIPDDNSKLSDYNPNRNASTFQFIKLNKAQLDDNQGATCYCDCNFIGFYNEFAKLHNVILDLEKIYGKEKGGEDLSTITLQAEKDEFFTYQKGFLRIECGSTPTSITYKFSQKLASNHLQVFLNNLDFYDKNVPSNLKNINDIITMPQKQQNLQEVFSSSHELRPDITVFVVTRYEYANIYYSMILFYNTFTNFKRLKLNADYIHVLLMDGHPKGHVDVIWSALFGAGVSRLNQYSDQIFIQDMVWVQLAYNSPINSYGIKPQYLEEFRNFFLTRFKVRDIDRKLNCVDLRILFIWRRDYVAHPRNPTGKIQRKIGNENELLIEAKRTCPTCRVDGIQLENLTMTEQIQKIADTDILIGMHGAGLAYALLLPQHAGLIEIFPIYTDLGNRHFQDIAKWRGLSYGHWKNVDPKYEKENYVTIIQPEKVSLHITYILHDKGCL